MNMTDLTDRKLRNIYRENAPQSTFWFMDEDRARKLHRAAYAELQRRRNNK